MRGVEREKGARARTCAAVAARSPLHARPFRPPLPLSAALPTHRVHQPPPVPSLAERDLPRPHAAFLLVRVGDQGGGRHEQDAREFHDPRDAEAPDTVGQGGQGRVLRLGRPQPQECHGPQRRTPQPRDDARVEQNVAGRRDDARADGHQGHAARPRPVDAPDPQQQGAPLRRQGGPTALALRPGHERDAGGGVGDQLDGQGDAAQGHVCAPPLAGGDANAVPNTPDHRASPLRADRRLQPGQARPVRNAQGKPFKAGLPGAQAPVLRWGGADRCHLRPARRRVPAQDHRGHQVGCGHDGRAHNDGDAVGRQPHAQGPVIGHSLHTRFRQVGRLGHREERGGDQAGGGEGPHGGRHADRQPARLDGRQPPELVEAAARVQGGPVAREILGVVQEGPRGNAVQQKLGVCQGHPLPAAQGGVEAFLVVGVAGRDGHPARCRDGQGDAGGEDPGARGVRGAREEKRRIWGG